ncbi:MAG: DUF2490 domain-containing protein [Bacteroidota bacterium]
MNKFIRLLYIGIAVVLFSENMQGQTTDAGLWMSLNVEKKITAKLSIALAEEFRMNENMTELGTFFTDVGLTYKINKYIRISGNYRFVNKRRLDDSYSKRHRYYFDLAFRKRFKPITISFRTRFQSQYADIFSSEDGKIPSYYSRNKLSIKYELNKKLSPYVSVELFSPLKKPYDIFMDNARYCIGLEYALNRMHSLDFFYLFQREYNVKDPMREHIIGVGYYFSF